MEYKNENIMKDELVEPDCPELEVKDVLKQDQRSAENISLVNVVDSKSGDSVLQGATQGDMGASGEVNKEASITTSDVIKAGGLGARDDINSFLPVASDSTDFEASLRDARDYEDLEEAICRPGLGWTEARESK